MSTLPEPLRIFLDVPPNQHTWSGLCSRLERLPDAEVAAMVPALLDSLQSWPDELRLLPLNNWAERWAKREPVAAWPLIRTLRFTGEVPKRALDGDDVGHTTGLHAIWLQGKGAAALQALAGAPRTLPFKRVLIDSHQESIPDAAIAAALKGKGLGAMAHLAFDGCKITDAEAKALAKNPGLAKLRGLALRGGELKAAGVKALLKSKHITGLEELDVHNNSLGKPGCREIGALVAAAGLPLRVLRAGSNRATSDEFAALLSTPLPATLRELEWGFQNAKDQPLIQALGQPGFPELEVIDLTSGRLTAEGLAALSTSPKAAALRSLSLYMNNVGPEGVRALAAGTALGRLEELNLAMADSYPASGEMDGALAELVQGPNLPSLHALELTHVELKEGFVDALIGSPARMERLVSLRLGHTKLGEPAIVRLCDALRGGAPRLSELNLSGNEAGKSAAARSAMEALGATGVAVEW